MPAPPRATRTDPRPGVLAWLRLARHHSRTTHALAEVLRPFGLSTAEFDVLAQLSPRGGLRQSDVARRLLVTQGNVTYLVRRLSQRGWVERRREGRSKRLDLTEAGRERLQLALPAVEAFHGRQLAALEAGEVEALLRALRRLERAGRTIDAHPHTPTTPLPEEETRP